MHGRASRYNCLNDVLVRGLLANIAISIENIKIWPLVPPNDSDANAGPGQNPDSPQPIPKRMLPITKGLSMVVPGGAGKAPPRTLILRLVVNCHAKNIGIIAPPITNINVGSQSPKRSKNPCTRKVSVIPETTRPVPKRPPQNRETKRRITTPLSRVRRQSPAHLRQCRCRLPRYCVLRSVTYRKPHDQMCILIPTGCLGRP